MATLKCDICGGNIVVQAGGQMGECANCGAAYSLERMREIVSGVKVSQTGTAEDVEQWRALLARYFRAGDFAEAERVVKKILEAVPGDEDAGRKYDALQVLKYLTVKNGVLMRYTGGMASLTVPNIVTAIGDGAFKGCTSLQSVVLPAGVVSIGQNAFADCSGLQHVTLPNTLTRIGSQAFIRCSSLQSITVPGSVTLVENWAFCSCTALRSAEFQNGVTTIGMNVFQECTWLQHVVIPGSVSFVGEGAFNKCPNLTDMQVDDAAMAAVLASGFTTDYDADYQLKRYYAKNYLEPLRASLREQKRCDYCGSKLTPPTFFSVAKCPVCQHKLGLPRKM